MHSPNTFRSAVSQFIPFPLYPRMVNTFKGYWDWARALLIHKKPLKKTLSLELLVAKLVRIVLIQLTEIFPRSQARTQKYSKLPKHMMTVKLNCPNYLE